MKISNNDSIKQASHSFLTAVAKNENHDTSSVDQWLSKAADVYISKSGKELSAAAQLRADKDTGAESSLQEINTKKEQINSDKQRISEIDQKLSEDDGSLTDKDKETLQKERETLQKRSETPEDIMHKKYQQINALEKQRDSGTLTGEDILVIDKQIDYLHIDINHQKNAVYQQGKTEESLSQKAVQERAVQDEKTTAKLDKQTESQVQEQTEQVSILQHESTTQDETRPLQVLQNAQQVEAASQSKKTSTINPAASTK